MIPKMHAMQQTTVNPQPVAQADDYQTSFPMIYGGASTGGPNGNGAYTINPPWQGPCEAMLIGIVNNGSAGGNGYISQGPVAVQASSIATSLAAGNSGTPGIVIDGNSPGLYIGAWFPIDGPLGFQVSGTGAIILVNFLFRRRRSTTLNRRMGEIYQPPAPQPTVTSGSQNRTMPERGRRRTPDGR